MLRPNTIGVITRTLTLSATAAGMMALALAATEALAFDETQYPDWSGQWHRPRGVGIQWDQTKPLGRGQQAPLTPEYQALFEASIWFENICAEGNAHVAIGKENYMLSADGLLMPARKNQAPPDLRYFQQTQR
jgi:hypothetical protein